MVALLRSLLFVPATRPDRFAKAAASGADAVVLDLEDAVGPDDKATARSNLSCDLPECPLIARINPHGTPWHDADLQAVRQVSLAAVMLPKAEAPNLIADVAQATGLPTIALVETALGLSQARAIAMTPGVVRMAFGSVDFCADLGCDHDRDVLLPARSELVLAARLAGQAAPIDGVTLDVSSPTAAHDDARHAKRMGMTGKLCIHPRQVAEVQRAFAPTETEMHWARRVLASGDGATLVDGQMVDEPVRIRARAILAGVEAG